ncbi:MAG: hypothetical protein CR997_10555 [Acidobacteria bacterium]|nr:MAG: hypothetical protein CR997_10555 [Acidobacteriota bacterium]
MLPVVISLFISVLALLFVFLFRLDSHRKVEDLKDRIDELQTCKQQIKQLAEEMTVSRRKSAEQHSGALEDAQELDRKIEQLRKLVENLVGKGAEPIPETSKVQQKLLEQLCSGQPVAEIAQDAGVPVGEVELLNNLRNYKKES